MWKKSALEASGAWGCVGLIINSVNFPEQKLVLTNSLWCKQEGNICVNHTNCVNQNIYTKTECPLFSLCSLISWSGDMQALKKAQYSKDIFFNLSCYVLTVSTNGNIVIWKTNKRWFPTKQGVPGLSTEDTDLDCYFGLHAPSIKEPSSWPLL